MLFIRHIISMIYRPIGLADGTWKIEAKWNNLRNRLTVLIDNEKVVDTGVDFFTGSGRAEAVYKGRQIVAQVIRSGGWLVNWVILLGAKRYLQIFVDGELICELRFS